MVALWPFRRRGSRRHSRAATFDPDIESRGRQNEPPLPVANATPIPITKRSSTTKLQRRNRAYSFSPGRHDSIRLNRAQQRRSTRKPGLATGSLPAITDTVYGDTEVSALRNEAVMPRIPTLHHNTSRNKRSGQPLPRKKSSKRRKEDHDREAEIKAMSQFMPLRAATDMGTTSRLTKRESRRVVSGQNRSWEGRPTSDVSLPMSANSGMSTDSEGVAWRVSALDALAPRPTLRYSSSPVVAAPIYGPGVARSQSARRKLAEREPIAESTLKAHKRVDDLADDLDASDLRELMERDQRRRDQKKERERLRVEKRLARRAERQRAEEAAAAKSGAPPPQHMERGVLGRDLPGPTNDSTSAIVTSSKRRSSQSLAKKRSQESGEKQPRRSSSNESMAQRRTPSPLDEFHRTDSIPPTPVESVHPDQEETPRAVPQTEGEPKSTKATSSRSSSPRIIGFIRSRKSRSKSPKNSEADKEEMVSPSPAFAKAEDGESSSKASNKSSRPWRSLLRWASRSKKRNSAGPSSFSNTSRDSMFQQPPPPPVTYVPPRRVSGGMPKRTMSRFREDLPELPLSPPDSRVASPEADPLPVPPLPIIPDDVHVRHDTPAPTEQSQEAAQVSPISTTHREDLGPSPVPQSMSLASIDSEGSWLSGGRAKQRGSVGMRSSLQQSVKNVSDGSEPQNSEHTDDEGVGDDEYLHSVVADKHRRQSTGEARPSSDEDEESAEPQWGSVAQTPRVMQHRDTIQSREGLLLQDVDENMEGDRMSEGTNSPDSPVGEPQRARSVNLGKSHVRNFSAGSAKLLNISPRASGEIRKSMLEHEMS